MLVLALGVTGLSLLSPSSSVGAFGLEERVAEVPVAKPAWTFDFAPYYWSASLSGSLSVEGSLVTDNRNLGIFAAGVDVTVVSSVVRDTLGGGVLAHDEVGTADAPGLPLGAAPDRVARAALRARVAARADR